MSATYIVSGEASDNLTNAVSDAIHAAVEAGLDMDAATTIAANVAVDYAKREYGPAYITQMFKVILDHL